MSDIGAMMMNSCYSEVGKSFDLPTQGFMGLSDANTLDSQSGFESGVGTVLAALSGLNVVAGAGMLDFAKCHSKEKLVIDNEICGAISHLVNGVQSRQDPMSENLYGNIDESDYFLTSPSTLEWFKREHYFPGGLPAERTNKPGKTKVGTPLK